MAFVRLIFLVLISLFLEINSITTSKRRPLVFVLGLKGFRWDLVYSYSNLPNFHRLSTMGSRALWVESELGGTRTNLLSLMSGLHLEHHARRDFIETIPIINEHVGGHTRLFHWPWFDGQRNNSAYQHLLTHRKGQPEIMELYTNTGRMSLQRLTKHITSMFASLIDENNRSNLIMSFIDEPFTTLTHHDMYSNAVRRTMQNIDRLIGRILTLASKKNVNLLVVGDHGIEQLQCRQPIHLYDTISQRQLNIYNDRHSGTSFSLVLYPKTVLAHRILLSQLSRIPTEQIEVHSNNQAHLPPRLRLPTIVGKPPPIIVFAKQQYYFSYTTGHSSSFCDRTSKDNNCAEKPTLADHSDDPLQSSMRTALFAYGPLFKRGHIIEPILMTDIYALLRQILCLSPFPSPTGAFRIHQMLDFTSLSNTCAHLYSSSINMIKSVSIKPSSSSSSSSTSTVDTQLIIEDQSDVSLIQINITTNNRRPIDTDQRIVQMHIEAV